jgi:hypothetical protein
MITVKNKHKSKPEKNDIYIGRGSILGNPFTHLDLNKTKAEFHCKTREESIESFEKYLTDKINSKDPKICSELNRIYLMALKQDINLVCFCKPKSCHGDIIKKIIETRIHNLNNFSFEY